MKILHTERNRNKGKNTKNGKYSCDLGYVSWQIVIKVDCDKLIQILQSLNHHHQKIFKNRVK